MIFWWKSDTLLCFKSHVAFQSFTTFSVVCPFLSKSSGMCLFILVYPLWKIMTTKVFVFYQRWENCLVILNHLCFSCPLFWFFFSIGITIFIFICFYLDFKDSPLMVIFLFYINENVLNNRIIELLRNKKIKRDVVLL